MNTYIAHHGILGQKWGVRRWQNNDGSLTPEGRLHYNQNGTLNEEGYRKANQYVKSGKIAKTAGKVVSVAGSVKAVTAALASVSYIAMYGAGTGAALATMTATGAIVPVGSAFLMSHLLKKYGNEVIDDAMKALSNSKELTTVLDAQSRLNDEARDKHHR